MASKDNQIFESEHNLSTKQMQIDVLIIKKRIHDVIHKNIGRIIRANKDILKEVNNMCEALRGLF